MTMRAHIRSPKAAQQLCDVLSAEWGERYGGKPLPRVEDESVGGKRHGRGKHGPWPTTEAYTNPIPHPTDDTKAAVVHDAFVESVAGKRRKLRGPSHDTGPEGTEVEVPQPSDAQELGPDWFPEDDV